MIGLLGLSNDYYEFATLCVNILAAALGTWYCGSFCSPVVGTSLIGVLLGLTPMGKYGL